MLLLKKLESNECR